MIKETETGQKTDRKIDMRNSHQVDPGTRVIKETEVEQKMDRKIDMRKSHEIMRNSHEIQA